MTQHTPGPWHAGGEGDAGMSVYAPNGYAVANATVFHGRFGKVQAKRNAALVAAAPDLLAALEHLLTVDVASEAGRYRDDRTQAQVAARAAIAKARGNTP